MAFDYKSAPFDEAISYLENRIALPSERWNNYKDSEANAAFWSAGAVDATLVSDLQKSVTRAIQNGTPYDSPEFAAQIANFSEQYGWDIKGGADWRARLILTQNLRQSYAAGRHDQQFDRDVMKLQPYLQYLHSDSRAPRPAHLALDGKVFRKDDPIVGSIYPPNGFNCGCSMVSLSQRQLDKKGLDVEQIALGDTLPYVDGNGQTKQAIIEPDKGFNSAPSSNAQQRQANLEKIKERLPKSWGKRIDKAIANLIKFFNQS
jgi:SPP1 gp7 family putative phage head morphogenesis protein